MLASALPPKLNKGGGGQTQAFELDSKLMFHTYCISFCMRNFSKNIDIWVIAKFYYLTFDPACGVRRRGKMSLTVMLIYRYWVIMAYSEKWSDIIALGKREVYYTKQTNTALI